MGAFVQGPFYCYYSGFTPADVQKGHELITDVIEEEGPFDGVFGFSQGASLALAYLFQHEVDHPNAPPPFKFAILFSSVVSFSPRDSFCQDTIERLTGEELGALASFPKTDFDVLGPEGRALFEPLANAMQSGVKGGFLPAPPDARAFQQGDTSRIPRILHPELTTVRLKVPTVHVVGKKDSPLMLEQSALMRRLCDDRFVKFLEHSAGHDVPRKMDDVKALVAAMEWAVDQSRKQFWSSNL